MRLSLSPDTPWACRPSEFNLWKSQQIATGFVELRLVPFHGGFLINKNNRRAPEGYVHAISLSCLSDEGNQKESARYSLLLRGYVSIDLIPIYRIHRLPIDILSSTL